MIKLLLLFMFSLSCTSSITQHEIDFFKSVYKPVLATKANLENSVDLGKRISFSAQGMKIQDFAVWFSKEFNKGIIYSNSFNDRLIFAELRNATQQEICNSVARHLNTGIVNLGNTFFIGALTLNDLGVFVKRIKGVKIEDLRTVVKNLTAEKQVEGHVTDDGIVIIVDDESSLLAYSRAFDVLENVDSGAWVVQLYLFDFKESFLDEFGIDLTGSGNLALKFLNSSLQNIPMASSGLNVDFALDALINVSRASDKVSIVSNPLFIMRDGSDFVFKNTDSIPQVKRTVSAEGVVSDTDVSFIDVGLKMNIRLRELKKGALLKLDISNEIITEITEDGFPRVNKTSVTSETPLNNSGVYLVAQTSFSSIQNSKKTFGFRGEKSVSTLQIFARVFKIDDKFKGLDSVNKINK